MKPLKGTEPDEIWGFLAPPCFYSNFAGQHQNQLAEKLISKLIPGRNPYPAKLRET